MDDLIDKLVQAKNLKETVLRINTKFYLCDRSLVDDLKTEQEQLYSLLGFVASEEATNLYRSFFEIKKRIEEQQKTMHTKYHEAFRKSAQEFIECYAPKDKEGNSVVVDAHTGKSFTVKILTVAWINKHEDGRVRGSFSISKSADDRWKDTLSFFIDEDQLKVHAYYLE